MVPELRTAIEQGRGLRALHLIDRLEEMEPGALWEDAKAGLDITIRHHSALEWPAMGDRPGVARPCRPPDELDGAGRVQGVPHRRARAGEGLDLRVTGRRPGLGS
jgi:hypothetical protein